MSSAIQEARSQILDFVVLRSIWRAEHSIACQSREERFGPFQSFRSRLLSPRETRWSLPISDQNEWRSVVRMRAGRLRRDLPLLASLDARLLLNFEAID